MADRTGRSADVVVIGAGHNGLVAAVLLARAGLRVTVLERADVIGGACRTERPFAKAPQLPTSTGAYLLGLMPPELLELLQLELPLSRRDPHYFLPTPDRRYLLMGSDGEANVKALSDFASEADARAAEALEAELGAIRDDVAPAWLAEPMPLEETAERYVRPELRETFVTLVRGSAIEYLERFGFTNDTLVTMYAATDGMPGLTGSPDSPGSGHNMLVHNMCRLPGSDGTWMAVAGGMGTVTGALAEAATRAGAEIRTNTDVLRIDTTGGAATGVFTAAGESLPATAVLVSTDPLRLPTLLSDACSPSLAERVGVWARASEGQTMKVNLALRGLPTFAALPDERGQHGTTVHLLPPPASDGSVLTAARAAYAAAAEGSLDAVPPLEWYLTGLSDPAGNTASGMFVQGVPHSPAGSTWSAEKDGYVAKLLDAVAAYVPDLHERLVDVHALTPPEIADHFGISSANIDHIDNSFAFTERMPYRAGVDGVYAGSAGCHPAGSVIGCAGHNAARAIMADLDANLA